MGLCGGNPRLFALDQFEEAALLSVRGFFLEQERQIAFFEFVDPVFPGNRLERATPREAREVNAKDAGRFASGGAAHGSRPTAACFRPFADRVVISGDVRGAAGAPSRGALPASRRG